MQKSVTAKREYEEPRVERVLKQDMVSYPLLEEMTLEEPKSFARADAFGVRLAGSAPSLHIVRVDVSCEFAQWYRKTKRRSGCYIMGGLKRIRKDLAVRYLRQVLYSGTRHQHQATCRLTPRKAAKHWKRSSSSGGLAIIL